MKVTVTIGELFDRAGDVDSACEELGLNPWCLNEGLADSSDEISLTEEQARKFGFLK